MRLRKLFDELKSTGEFRWEDLFCIFISIVALIILSVNIPHYTNFKILISGLIIYFSIVFSNCCAIMNKKKVIGSKIENKTLETKNKNLLEITDNVRCFKHDFNNIIQAIEGYLLVKDMNSLQKYLDSLVDECDRINLIDILNGQISDNPAICGVLINKLKIAEKNNIKMNIEILASLKNFKDKSYLISRMLGILLDNALEASNSCFEQKIVNVRFSSENSKNKNMIIIENTYDNKNVDTDKIFEKNYTTKKGNTGLGLWKIRDILAKDNSFELQTSKDDNIFRQELEIYNSIEEKVLI